MAIRSNLFGTFCISRVSTVLVWFFARLAARDADGFVSGIGTSDV